MPRHLPPAQALQAFEAAARHMSFTEAARELRLTQAAISQRIRLLEHRLGQTLFLRHPRGLELTEAGRAFVPAVHEAFERLSTGMDEAFGPAPDVPLTLRTTPGFAAHWLAPRLHRFRAQHPGINLRVSTAVWPNEFDLEGADVEVRYGRGDWNGVECVRLTRERLAPVCTPAMARELARPGDLAGRTLLHAVGFESGWPHWLAAAGAEHVLERSGAVLGDTTAVTLAFALQGAGIAMGRSGFVAPMLAEGRLAAPFDLWLETDEAFFLTRVAGRAPGPEAQALWSWLAAAAEAADDGP